VWYVSVYGGNLLLGASIVLAIILGLLLDVHLRHSLFVAACLSLSSTSLAIRFVDGERKGMLRWLLSLCCLWIGGSLFHYCPCSFHPPPHLSAPPSFLPLVSLSPPSLLPPSLLPSTTLLLLCRFWPPHESYPQQTRLRHRPHQSTPSRWYVHVDSISFCDLGQFLFCVGVCIPFPRLLLRFVTYCTPLASFPARG